MAETYAAYLVKQVPRRAADQLSKRSDAEVLREDTPSVVAVLADEYRIPSVSYIDGTDDDQYAKERTPYQPSDGVAVYLRVENPRAWRAFATITPSTMQREPPGLRVEGQHLIFGCAARDVKRHLDAIKANINRRNLDIERGEEAMREHLTNVVEARKRSATQRQAEHEQAMRDLEGSGIPLRRESSVNIEDAEVPSRPEPEPQARVEFRVIPGEADLRRASQLLKHLEDQVHTLIDADHLSQAGVRIAEGVLLPELALLSGLLGQEGNRTADRGRLVKAASASAGAVMASLRVLPTVTAAVVGTANFDEFVENVRRVTEMMG